MATPPDQVQEMQGLYGPFTIAERVVQKIWLRRDFNLGAACVQDGRRLEIHGAGRWNLLGGPDFLGARVVIGGVVVSGDIEVHFHVSDWRAHGHESDSAYSNVVLHVVMFPLAAGERGARRGDGTEIPTLVLLPLLHRSLEEYASDDALENITARDTIERIAELLRMSVGETRRQLQAMAESRWAMKKHFAALRIEKLGWTGAAHHTALEILGYRRNRAAMLTLAAGHALEDWSGGLDIDELYAERAGQWELQGVRPANHPRVRLRQYLVWAELRPDWPAALHDMVPVISDEVAASTVLFRKQAGLPGLRDKIAREVLANSVGGSRLDTMVCDGFLPLIAAATGRELMPYWFHWPMGDVPVEIRRGLQQLGVSGRGVPPHCHGWAQGLLGWLLERDARASR